MKNCYIVMEVVDLGGHPVKAFFDKEKAQEAVNAGNAKYTKQKISNLVKDCKYSLERAELWVQCHGDQFYLETVNIS